MPGKLLYTADALSRAPLPRSDGVEDLPGEAEAFVNYITIPSIPATPQRLNEYKQAQLRDAECAKVRKYCKSQWPNKYLVDCSLKPYWRDRGALTLCDDLLMHGSRVIVPRSLRRQTMLKIHEGHQGAERCKLRVKSSVWWPGVTGEVQQFAENCRDCAKEARHRREPLLPTPLPDYPWQVVGTDLFEFKGANYLLVVDYFSRYPEVANLTSTTSRSIIEELNLTFA